MTSSPPFADPHHPRLCRVGPWGSKGLSSPFPYENCCSKRWKNMKSSDHGNAAWFSGIRDFSWHNHLGVCVSFMPAHITLKDSPVQTYILKITTSSPELFSMLLTYHIHTHILTPHTHIDQQRAAFSCPVPREVVAVFFYFFFTHRCSGLPSDSALRNYS